MGNVLGYNDDAKERLSNWVTMLMLKQDITKYDNDNNDYLRNRYLNVYNKCIDYYIRKVA